jgi:hypothetical protein
MAGMKGFGGFAGFSTIGGYVESEILIYAEFT